MSRNKEGIYELSYENYNKVSNGSEGGKKS